MSEREGISGFRDPFDALLAFKRVLVLAATKSALDAQPSDCESAESRLHWISRAKSAIRASDRGLLCRSCSLLPNGGELFDIGT